MRPQTGTAGQMDDFDVGKRLQNLRNAAGLSQRQLAEASGVRHGQISMVETNKSSPSVSSLRKILGGPNITMSEFFDPHPPVAPSFFSGPIRCAI
ncbi:MAG: helix-turn-helix domain-containing protein [Paracoccus sp. (in: a-proteobacteria)]|nr:helix-turn-helix domain-containing protein [Paracoccus sp. (in: a-proteobacteria)]